MDSMFLKRGWDQLRWLIKRLKISTFLLSVSYLYLSRTSNVAFMLPVSCCMDACHSMYLSFVFIYLLFKLNVPSEPGAAVPVLPGPGANCNVSTQQQQPVPGILQKSSPRVSAQRPVCVSVHRWPHAVPLHQGKEKLIHWKYNVYRSVFL